jgi:hypothetical protein
MYQGILFHVSIPLFKLKFGTQLQLRIMINSAPASWNFEMLKQSLVFALVITFFVLQIIFPLSVFLITLVARKTWLSNTDFWWLQKKISFR